MNSINDVCFITFDFKVVKPLTLNKIITVIKSLKKHVTITSVRNKEPYGKIDRHQVKVEAVVAKKYIRTDDAGLRPSELARLVRAELTELLKTCTPEASCDFLEMGVVIVPNVDYVWGQSQQNHFQSNTNNPVNTTFEQRLGMNHNRQHSMFPNMGQPQPSCHQFFNNIHSPVAMYPGMVLGSALSLDSMLTEICSHPLLQEKPELIRYITIPNGILKSYLEHRDRNNLSAWVDERVLLHFTTDEHGLPEHRLMYCGITARLHRDSQTLVWYSAVSDKDDAVLPIVTILKAINSILTTTW